MGLRGVPIAYVDLKPEHQEVNLFGETVAVNRGVGVKFFQEVAKAEAWLLAQEV